LLLLPLVNGCTFFSKQSVVKNQEKIVLDIQPPSPVVLRRITPIVVTEENSKQQFEKLKAKGIDPVVFGMTDVDYQAMSENLGALQKFIVQQNEIIKAYREYYEKQH